jgi:hypothetical protein
MIMSRRMRWVWHVARMGEVRNAAGKPERKRAVGRPRRRCVNYIKFDVQEVVREGVVLNHLAQRMFQ